MSKALLVPTINTLEVTNMEQDLIQLEEINKENQHRDPIITEPIITLTAARLIPSEKN
jgi:hypothetical protein